MQLVNTTRRRFIAAGAAALGATALGRLPAATRGRRGAFFRERFWFRHGAGWGWPWFNQRYQRRWWADGQRGIYRLPPAANDTYYRPNPVLVLDHDVADIDVRATISLSNGTARGGLVARAISYGH